MKKLHEFPNIVLAKQPLTIYVWLQKDGGTQVIGRARETYAEALDPANAVRHLIETVDAVRNSLNRERQATGSYPCIVRLETEINP